MNFFEQELQRIVSPIHPDATYVGRACYVPLGEDMVAKLQFTTCGHADHYTALKMSVLNSKQGEVDSLLLSFFDFFARQPDRSGYPYIWMRDLEAVWYVRPTMKELATMRNAVANYLSVFQTQGQTMEQSNAPNCQQTMPL